MKLENTVQNLIRTVRQGCQRNVTIFPSMNGNYKVSDIANISLLIFIPEESEYFVFDTTYEQTLQKAKRDAYRGCAREAFVAKKSKTISANVPDGLSKVFWLKSGSSDHESVDAIHIWKKYELFGISHYSLSESGRRHHVETYFVVDLNVMRRGSGVLGHVKKRKAMRELWLRHLKTQFVYDKQFDLLEVAAHLCSITKAAQPIQPANCNVQPARGKHRHPDRWDAETNLPEGGISFAIRRLHYADGMIEGANVEPMDGEEYDDLVEDGHAMAANDDGMAGYEDLPVVDLAQHRRRRRENGPRALHTVRGHWRHTKHRPEGVWIKSFMRGDENKTTLNKITRPRKKRQK